MKKYKEIKKELNITDADVSVMFGYKTPVAYSTSSAKSRIEKGIENLYQILTMKTSTDKLFKGNKAKRVWLNETEHLSDPKNEALNFGFIYGGLNDNNQQVFLNTSAVSLLSPREKEVYSLKEMDNARIAKMIGISEKTVESYRNKIKSKGF